MVQVTDLSVSKSEVDLEGCIWSILLLAIKDYCLRSNSFKDNAQSDGLTCGVQGSPCDLAHTRD